MVLTEKEELSLDPGLRELWRRVFPRLVEALGKPAETAGESRPLNDHAEDSQGKSAE